MARLAAKLVLYGTISCVFFAYGLAVGHFKVFPYSQLAALKARLETTFIGVDQESLSPLPDSVTIQETTLQRLLLRKIPVPFFEAGGGAMGVAGGSLFVVTNKGKVLTFDLEDFSIRAGDASDVPMNLSGLMQSGHPNRNEFRLSWFRVSGVYAEPATADSIRLFVSHNGYEDASDCITHNVSHTELTIRDGDVSQSAPWHTIFTASPCIDPVPEKILAVAPYPGHISGGVLTGIGKDDLLVAVGDYNRHGIDGTPEWATLLSNPYGKFLLVNKRSGDWRTFSVGNRNASGIYRDANSVIWAVENGPAGGDELNILAAGANYGWPKVSYGIWYQPQFDLPGGEIPGTHPRYTKPVFAWVPSIAPRGLTKVDGDKFQYWKGDLLVGSMRDQSLRRLRLDESNRVVYDERIHLAHRIRDLTTLPDGKIALITDDALLIVIDDGGASFKSIDSAAQQRMTALERLGRRAAAGDKSMHRNSTGDRG